MCILEVGFFVVGALLLLVGYHKANRNLLLTAAVSLFLSGTVSDIGSGFLDGISSSQAAAIDAS